MSDCLRFFDYGYAFTQNDTTTNKKVNIRELYQSENGARKFTLFPTIEMTQKQNNPKDIFFPTQQPI